LERERVTNGLWWRSLAALDRGPGAAAAGPLFFRGQPGRRSDRVDGELRRAVEAAAGRGRSAQRRRLGRLGRVGAVHENLRRWDGRAEQAVRQSQAKRGGPTVSRAGHGGRGVQPTRVRTGVRQDGGRGATFAGRQDAQRGGHCRRPVDSVVRPVDRGRCPGRFAESPVRLAAKRQDRYVGGRRRRQRQMHFG